MQSQSRSGTGGADALPCGADRGKPANLLSASRFVLAALWLAAFLLGKRSPEILGTIAVAGAFSDLIDGPLARRMCAADAFGHWLDNLADVVLVLTALTCEAQAGAIPLYIPALIAASFTQYAMDSLLINRSRTPIRSQLGHWSGVLNFALVIVLAFAPSPRLPGVVIRALSPLIAICYMAAIFERALQYRRRRMMRILPAKRRDYRVKTFP
jgi:phosphatidylglycerophosphate synthase